MNKNLINVQKLLVLSFKLIDRVNDIFLRLKHGLSNMIVYEKGSADHFTNIDYLIQKMFENNFNHYFPELLIVGEEDMSKVVNTDGFENYMSIIDNLDPQDFLNNLKFFDNFDEIDFKRLKLYMDPIDSTKNFIKKDFAPVTTLIGFTLDNQPFFGLIHYPYNEEKSGLTETYFNLPSKGVFCLRNSSEISKVEYSPKTDNISFITSSSKVNEKQSKLFSQFKTIKSAGLGNKVIKSMETDSVYVSTGSGLGFWDICSGHCIFKELGGSCLYINGEEIEYNTTSNTIFLKNIIGMSANSKKLDECIKLMKNAGFD